MYALKIQKSSFPGQIIGNFHVYVYDRDSYGWVNVIYDYSSLQQLKLLFWVFIKGPKIFKNAIYAHLGPGSAAKSLS